MHIPAAGLAGLEAYIGRRTLHIRYTTLHFVIFNLIPRVNWQAVNLFDSY